jgi:ketosteroid isomerase-like protein
MNEPDKSIAEERNLSVIKRYYNGCTLGDLEMLCSTLHEDVVHYFLAPNIGTKPVSGREHLARYWRKVTSAIDARWVVDQAVTMDDQTVIEWTMFWRPTPEAERIATRGAEWFVFRDGVILEIRSYYQQHNDTTELDAFDYSKRGYSTLDTESSFIHSDAADFAAPKRPENEPT